MADITLKPKMDTQELDEAIEKASRLVELLREAQRLANSLAGRPEMDGKELFERIKGEMDKEITRHLQAQNQSGPPFQ